LWSQLRQKPTVSLKRSRTSSSLYDRWSRWSRTNETLSSAPTANVPTMPRSVLSNAIGDATWSVVSPERKTTPSEQEFVSWLARA
jgi:hypothetical protein